MKKFIYLICLLGLFLLIGCEKGINVKFDSDGGSAIETQNVTETGIAVEPENPVKTGYAFLGWYLNGEKFNFSTQVAKSITLKAKWVPGVEVDFSGAGIEEFIMTFPVGETVELPIPEREGYTFLAWVDEEENEYKETGSFTASCFLEASWHKIETYNLVYRDEDIVLKSETITEGEKPAPYSPTKKGYTFAGWYTNTAFTKEFDFNNLSRSNSIFAKFIPNTYAVSFSNAGITTKIPVKFDSEIGTLPVISIAGATFNGWRYNGEMIYSFTKYTFDEDITLVPDIKIKSKFIIDDTDYQTVEYQLGSAGPYREVDKVGKIFAGWYENSAFTGEPVFTINDIKYANKNLYAKYVDADNDQSLSKIVVSEIEKYYFDLLEGKYIYDDLELRNKDLYYGATIEWSSDTNQIAINGKVTRTKENVEAHLTAKITYNGYTETMTYNVIVKEDIYKDISKNVIVSYCYSGTMGRRGVDEILLNTADVINLAFAEAQTDGSLVLSVSYVEMFKKFKDAARAKGVRTLITIGPPSDPSRFVAIAQNETLRKKFASNIVDAINEYGFNGVDVDWEYPTSSQKSDYTALMKEIYTQVKDNNPEDLVTSAIPAGPYTYPNYDLKNSIQYLDYINMMSYDMQAETSATHHAALYANTGAGTISGCSVDESVKVFTNTTNKVPLEKIVIGAAFYGRMATTKSTTGTRYLTLAIEKDSKFTSITYNAIKNSYLTLSTCKEYWDDKAKAPYCYDTASRTFISYDNPRSIQAKCDYVVSKGVRGLMWWDYGSDTTGDLIKAVNGKLTTMKQN